MLLNYVKLNCGNNVYDVNRAYTIVECKINTKTDEFKMCKDKALQLANNVNPGKANDSSKSRGRETLLLDALAGVLSELGWYTFIITNYGEIVRFMEFKTAVGQIDLLLSNKKSIEVRSSFSRNGIKFSLCNKKYNFKNICKYNNLYKKSEIDKDFFACTLFETQKNKLLDEEIIKFFLIGGSTREMMENPEISYTDSLRADGDNYGSLSEYRIIKICNALDIIGFENYLNNMGYKKINK